MSSNVKFYDIGEVEFVNATVVALTNTITIEGYINQESNKGSLNGAAWLLTNPQYLIVKLSNVSKLVVVERDDIIKAIISGIPATTKLWNEQVSLAVCPKGYIL